MLNMVGHVCLCTTGMYSTGPSREASSRAQPDFFFWACAELHLLSYLVKVCCFLISVPQTMLFVKAYVPPLAHCRTYDHLFLPFLYSAHY